ncbi:MAG: DUF484 family protein [Pseudomonadota bacterium]
MSSPPKLTPALREAILSNPQDILDDRDMMQALISSNERRMGANIVDLRGIAMDRLETRLDRLKDTHRSVIAAAYENLAGNAQIQRAVLRLLEAEDFGLFLSALKEDVAQVLRVDAIRLLLEVSGEPLLTDDGHGVLSLNDAGFIDRYLAENAPAPQRDVILRPAPAVAALLYDEATHVIQSEACIRLDIGTPGVAGLLALGAHDPSMFSPQQGTDLLSFLGSVIERLMRRWVL